jgi:hypothetical protein
MLLVEHGTLSVSADGPIDVDTAAWFGWLETADTFGVRLAQPVGVKESLRR